jgi:VIT1/CCC1 family predicted Fe2+/Mn2+ transporter
MSTASLITYLLIGLAILLPMGVLKYLIREKYVGPLLDQNETYRQRVSKSNEYILKWGKLFLYLFPVIMIVLPYTLYKDAQVDLLTSIIFTVLMCANVALEYFYRRWLSNYLMSKMS